MNREDLYQIIIVVEKNKDKTQGVDYIYDILCNKFKLLHGTNVSGEIDLSLSQIRILRSILEKERRQQISDDRRKMFTRVISSLNFAINGLQYNGRLCSL